MRRDRGRLTSPLLKIIVTGLLWTSIVTSGAVAAEETRITLQIEGSSFVSFQNEALLPIPAGSSIVFRFGTLASDGSIPFRVEPSDLQVRPIPIGRGARGKYELVRTTSGVMRRGANGLEMSFPARIRATTIPAEGLTKSVEYDLVFTTARATAMSADRSKSVAPQGRPVNEMSGAVELVVATTNRMDAGPIPGAATFAYLVGQFDVVPGKTTAVRAP